VQKLRVKHYIVPNVRLLFVAGGHPKTNSKEADNYMQTKKEQNKLYYERHKEQILENRKHHRAIHGQKQYYTPEKQRAYWRRWYFRNRERYWAAKKLYFSKPENRQRELERLYRYVENNPFCNIAKMERIIKTIERTVSLDASIGENFTRYDLVSA